MPFTPPPSPDPFGGAAHGRPLNDAGDSYLDRLGAPGRAEPPTGFPPQAVAPNPFMAGPPAPPAPPAFAGPGEFTRIISAAPPPPAVAPAPTPAPAPPPVPAGAPAPKAPSSLLFIIAVVVIVLLAVGLFLYFGLRGP
jgi:hypothetical protein